MGQFRKVQAMFWRVKVRVATAANKFATEMIDIKYVRLGREELDDLVTRTNPSEDMDRDEASRAQHDAVQEIIDNYIVDWKIEDESGEPIEFTPENLAMVMNHMDYSSAIMKGFWAFQRGGAAKN
jgi:hypothetical protein